MSGNQKIYYTFLFLCFSIIVQLRAHYVPYITMKQTEKDFLFTIYIDLVSKLIINMDKVSFKTSTGFTRQSHNMGGSKYQKCL